MADPQSTLAASTDSQELPQLNINPQGESGNKTSGLENPSGATKMTTSDSPAEEAEASSRPIVPPEAIGMHIFPRRFLVYSPLMFSLLHRIGPH